MDPEDTTLEIFLRDRMKERGVSLKKLSDLTGIAMNHIENMLRGDFEHIPSTPYFRGYLIRIGEVLNFDGEAWWEKIKKEEGVKKSGPSDAMPKNRFAHESPLRVIVISAAILIILIVAGFALPHIQGKPVITIVAPQGNPYATTSDSIVIQGTVENADSLYVNTEEVVVGSNGAWQKNVFLTQDNPNTFDISAKKFLGGTTDITEQIIYSPPAGATTTSSSSPSSAITAPTAR